MDGGIAVAIVVILLFAGFIFWAKSATGRDALRNSLGDPHGFSNKRKKLVKRHTTGTSGTTRKSPPTKRSSR